MNTRPCSAPRGAGQSGRCPAHRTVPGGFEAFGAAQATNVVVVNGSLVDGRQELLTANLGSAPRRQAVDVTNAPSGALEAGNSLEGTPTLMRQKTSHSGPKLESKKTSDMQLYPPPPPPPVLRAASAAVAILLGTLCSHAADRFVSLAGGHVPPFTSWADAATNIQAAVDAASAGETVWVTNGVYATGGKVKAGSLTNRVALDKAITLQSINGAAETIIEGAWDSTSTNGPGAVRCVWLADGAVIRGFTLRNGATASSGDTTTLRSGGAVWGNSTNAWVEDCVLTKSRASSFGGGAWNARLRNCAVVGNAAGSQGGGVYSSAVESSTVSGNFASSYGGGAAYALLTSSRVTANRAVVRGGGSYNGTLNNCAVVQNELSGAGAGGKDGAGSLGSTLNNCTVIWNRSVGSSTTGAGAYSGAANNCIVWENYAIDTSGYVRTNNCGGGVALRYTCTINSPPVSGTGLISSDPRLLPDGIHIASDSPCRSAGDAVSASGTDLDGQTWANPPSMGCDEWAPEPVIAGGPSLLTSTNANLAWLSATAAGQGPFQFVWWKDGQFIQPSLHHQGTTTGLVTINGLDVGDAGTYRVAVSNAFGWATSAVAVVTIRCVDAASPAPAAPFTNWAGAARAIQDAVDAGNAGDLVLVADGLYATGGKTVSTSVTNRVVLDKPLTVLSLHGPASTIIEGQRDPNTTNGPLSARGAFLEDGAFLKGFMVRGASSGTTYTSDGAGVFCRTVLAGISGCVLSNNIASGNGGGVSRGTVVDSLVVNNTAGADGGGAFGSGMERCLVSGNAARNGGGVASGRAQASRLQNNAALSNGGGAYGSTARNSIIAGNIALSGGGAATTDMVNSTIVGNTTKTATGALMGGNLTNCIVWGNLALAVTSTANGVASLAFSCSAPLPSGPGNISADPQLLDSYHLAVTSPCRGTGTNTASGVDLDGEPWANPPSMGCDEVWEAALTGPLAVGVSAAWPVVAARGVLPLAGSVSGRAARVAWDFGDGTALTNASLLNTTHVWTNPGSYTVTFTAFNTDYPGGVATNLTVQVVPLAAPKLVSGGRTGSTFSLSFPGQAGVTYVVQQTTNLAPPVTWQALTTLTSTGQVMQVLDSTATNAMRFYRTQVP